MLGLLLLLTSFFLGVWLTAKFLPFFAKTSFFWPVSWFLGLWASTNAIFLLACLGKDFNDPLSAAIVIFFIFAWLILGRWWVKWPRFDWKKTGWRLIFFVFSFWLFSRTFAYQNGRLLVASNNYLDFGAHLPIIRSFSRGENFFPQMPFYAGQPLFYHFLFDFATSVFEKAGWTIALSYNLLSALSLSALLLMIFYFCQKIFSKISFWGSFLAVVFFVFTPDLSFLFFPCQSNLKNWLTAIRNHNFYLNNGLKTDPFFGGFFNLNVFTNQRHLVFGLGLFLIFALILDRLRQKTLKNRAIIFVGLFMGSLPFWHNFILLAVVLVYLMAMVFGPQRKAILKILVAGGLVALPQLIFIQQYTQNQIVFRPGFLVHDNLSLFNWLKFWFFNLGFGLFAIIGGWLILPKKARSFLTPFWALFLIPNFFSFAQEPFNDHKFFVVFSIFAAMIMAWFVFWLWQRKFWGRFLALAMLFLLTFSGGLALLVVKNDVWVGFNDIPRDEFLQWVEKKTKPSDVFLTNLGIWNPLGFTGRQVFLGRPHYLFAYGFNPSDRQREKETVLTAQDDAAVRRILNNHQIDYLAFQVGGAPYQADFFAKNFKPVFQNQSWTVFAVK